MLTIFPVSSHCRHCDPRSRAHSSTLGGRTNARHGARTSLGRYVRPLWTVAARADLAPRSLRLSRPPVQISGQAINNFNGWGVTIIDSLDTLVLMGLKVSLSSVAISVCASYPAGCSFLSFQTRLFSQYFLVPAQFNTYSASLYHSPAPSLVRVLG